MKSCVSKAIKIILTITVLAVACALIGICGCAKKYTVTYLATEGGYIDGETVQTVKAHKDTSYVYVEPYDGYYFDCWSDGDGHFVRSDKNVTSDITVTAIFKRRTFTVKYIAEGNGTIQGESIQTVNMYENSTEVTAVPNEGYAFVKWSDGVTQATRHEESVEDNLTVYAQFERRTYSVRFSAGGNGTIDGESEQTVAHGYKCLTVTAKPDWGYVFVGWSDGVQTASRSDTVTGEINATAYFKRGFDGGDGTVKNPFTISTYEHLCNIVFYPAEYFKLINNLDLSGINHRPLFEEAEPSSGSQPFAEKTAGQAGSFSGEFDGGGHSIINLTVDCDSEYPSLFGVLGGGFVKNLKIENAKIKAKDFDTAVGKYYVGILAGVLNAFVENITVSGEITAEALRHDGVAVGGMVGQAFFPMMDCTANVTITATDIVSNNKFMTDSPFCFGGLAGVCSAWSVVDCTSEIAITINDAPSKSNGTHIVSVGGLIGYCFGGLVDSEIDGEGANIRIINCHSYVDVIENNSSVDAGGFISVLSANEVFVSECTSNGNIRSSTAGGFFYGLYVSRVGSLIEKCRSECNLICRGYAVGFGGRFISNLTFSECYVGGTITSTAHVSGFCTNSSRVTFQDCVVESQLTGGGIVCGFASLGGSGTVFERCSFIGSIKSSKYGAGICFVLNNSKIINCYSVGNINIENGERVGESISAGGFCVYASDSEIENSYFAGRITVEAEYSSSSLVGILAGQSKNSTFNNCHVLHEAGSDFEAVVGNSLGDENVFDISSYSSVEEMYLLADALNEGQEQPVWQNVENGLPEFIKKSR